MGKTSTIKFRCEDPDCAMLTQNATNAGISISEYCRSKLFEPDKALFRDPETKNEIVKATREINKIGINVNQIVRSAHSKNWISDIEIEKLCTALEAVETLENKILKILMEKM